MMTKKSYIQQTLLLLFALFSQSFLQAQCETGVTISSASGDKVVYTCPGDGNDDIIEFANTHNGAANFVYVITDDNNVILGIPPGNSQNFEGAGIGTCRVWGFSYTGDILATPGESVFSTFFSNGCWAISNDFLAVVRSTPDGGTVAMPGGATERTVCASDGYDDPVVFTHQSSSPAAYQYVITDDQNNILGLPGNSLNFEGVPPGICHVWGLSYTGTIIAGMGDNATTASLSNGCWDLSDNFITITRIDVVGGSVADSNGESVLNTCVGDGNDDIVTFTHQSSSAADYAYFITDENNYVLGVPPGNSQNFEGAGVGVCRVWGISYTGTLNIYPGDLATNKSLSSGCFDLSDNFIEVRREDCGMIDCMVNGGIIAPEGATVYNRVAVANRASGTVSVIDGDMGTLVNSYPMPNNGQPMYVVHNARNNTVLVGDYNGSVVAFDGMDFSVRGTATAAAGVFHMWMSSDQRQLWVNNELDKSVSVINPMTMETIRTFDIPADLEMTGFKPHDVIVDPDNGSAYVTMINGMMPINYVVKYDARTFNEIDRVEVGGDPHVALTANNDKLYVASQAADLLQVFNRGDLSLVTTVAIPNAHGLGMNAAGTYLYVGNISEGGTDATYTVDLATNTLVGDPVDAPYAAPHNYSVGSNDSKLYLTHSGGASDKLSVYDLGPTPTLSGELSLGNNPFGLVAYSFADTNVSICAGDGQSDAFNVDLSGNTGNSAWIITDENGNILGLPPGPPFDLEGAGAGTCLIWHISTGADFAGAQVGNNATTDLQGCYQLSNPIYVFRSSADGGMVSTLSGETMQYTCPGDGVDDIVMFTTTSAASNYQYVVTDDNNIILGLPPGNSQNFEGAPAGTCRVWGLAYNGNLTAMPGDDAGAIALADGCFSLSANYITIVRDVPNGGAVATVDGESMVYTCPGDGSADIVEFAVSGNSNSNFTYVITDDQNNILGIPPGNSQDFNGAPAGTCRVWGLAYTGNVIAQAGDNVASVALTDGCFDLSENYITIVRDTPNGGTVRTPDGETMVYTCTQDGSPDIVEFAHDNASNSNYQYVITDDQNNILGLPPGNSQDFNVAPPGTCRVWGFAYTGDLTAKVGDHVFSTLFSTDCWAISPNYISVVRDTPDGGTVATTSGATSVTVTVGDGIDDVLSFTHNTSANSLYAYVVTDDQNNILGLPPGNSQNFEGAPAGICRVWGLSYTGSIIAQPGDNTAAVALSDDCFSLSSNYIEVIRLSNGSGNLVNQNVLSLNGHIAAKGKLSLAPNPVVDHVTARFDINTEIQERATLSIYNLAGQEIYTENYDLYRGHHSVNLSLYDLESGLYFMVLRSNSMQLQERFTKIGGF